MRIDIENFSGIAPAIDPRKLGSTLAQTAKNCWFEKQTLGPLKSPKLVAGATCTAGSKTIFPYQGAVIDYPEYVDIVRSPLPNDAYDRLFMTDSTYPKVRSGADEYRLGIPRPASAPGATATDVPDPESAEELLEAETVYYVYCYVDAFGAEGPPSPVSSSIERVRDTNVDLTFAASPPAGDYNFGAGSLIRVYRSNTGTQDTGFQFVQDLAMGTTAWTDTVPNDQLAEVLPSGEWIGPPDDDASWVDGPLQGLTAMPNGVMAGFTKNTVHFCEPYLPHAWPLRYRVATKNEIVGITMIGSGLLVVTKGKPFLIVGTEPASMTDVPLEGDSAYPCESKQSLVNMGEYALYATDTGIAMAEGNRIVLATDGLLDKDTWKAYTPSSIVAEQHEGRYIGFYDTGAVTAGFIFDPLGDTRAFSTTDIYSDALFQYEGNNTLYLKQNSTEVHKWNADTDLTYTWKSKEFPMVPDVSFAFLELFGDVTSTQVTLTSPDDTHVFTATSRYSVLPGLAPAKQWAIELQGTDNIVMASLTELLDG